MAARMEDMLRKRIAALRTERSSFVQHWRDIAQFISPRRGRFDVTERNRGEKPYGSIVNGKATWALRESAAGLFTGTMSPARPWHWLKPASDPELAEFAPVKAWLYHVVQQQRDLFRRSNLYHMAHLMMKDLLLFGTACMAHDDDADGLARFSTEPVGSFMIAHDARTRVHVVVREKLYTVEQVVERFGRERASVTVQNGYDRGDYDRTVECVHYVGPNREHDESDPFSKRWISIYAELGELSRGRFLRQHGFNVFPYYVPRWEVTGNDTYATDCPGMQALGDVRSLQTQERGKALAVAKMVEPPLRGPPSLRNTSINTLPNGLTLVDAGNDKGLQSVYQVDPKVGELNIDIARTEERIDKAFFVDLFRAISSMEGVQPRNQLELSQRNQEALLQLGPALQRLHTDFFEHLIDRTFMQQVEAGTLPPPPQELQGQRLEVQFVSSLAMAQQQVSTGNIERLASFVGGLAGAGFADALDKFDADQAVDMMAELTGTPPEVVRSDADVAQMRQARQAAQEQERQAAMEAQEASTMQTLARAEQAS